MVEAREDEEKEKEEAAEERGGLGCRRTVGISTATAIAEEDEEGAAWKMRKLVKNKGGRKRDSREEGESGHERTNRPF
jgi:hypothetical protein